MCYVDTQLHGGGDLRTCSTCSQAFCLNAFYRCKSAPRGHTYICKACHKNISRERYLRDREHILATTSRWKADNRDKINKRSRERYHADPERHRAYASAAKKKNRATATHWQRLRYARKLQATPPWFEAEAVANVYKKAAEFGFCVDHIVPLQSDIVCGLHCWANLQLMERALNSSKGNREWPDMPFPENPELIHSQMAEFSD
jgi:hypothetical protein